METKDIAQVLREELKHRIVKFTFRKKDGSIREAIGTRNLNKAEAHLGTTITPPKGDFVNENAYYDLEREAWRSFIPYNIISIDD